MARDELVHDATARADKFVFGFLAKQRQLCAIGSAAALAQQSKTDRDFDGGRGTQACAERHVTADQKICSAQAIPRTLQRPSNA